MTVPQRKGSFTSMLFFMGFYRFANLIMELAQIWGWHTEPFPKHPVKNQFYFYCRLIPPSPSISLQFLVQGTILWKKNLSLASII